MAPAYRYNGPFNNVNTGRPFFNQRNQTRKRNRNRRKKKNNKPTPNTYCKPPLKYVPVPVPASTQPSSRALEIFVQKLEKLLLLDRTKENVPAAMLMAASQFVNCSGDDVISQGLVNHFKSVLKGEVNLGVPPENITRLLWVLGQLFTPGYWLRVAAVKSLVPKAAKCFCRCLKMINPAKIRDNDALQFAREEMRCILQFYRNSLHYNAQIVESIDRKVAPSIKFQWVLYAGDIRKDVEMSHVYQNEYLVDPPKSILPEGRPQKGSKVVDLSSSDGEHEVRVVENRCSNEISEVAKKPKNSKIANATGKKPDKNPRSASVEKPEKLPTAAVEKPDKPQTPPVENLKSLKKKRPKTVVDSGPALFSEFHKVASPTVIPIQSDYNWGSPSLSISEMETQVIRPFESRNATFVNSSSQTGSSASNSSPHPQPSVSKLEQFRKAMGKDEAVTSLQGVVNWNDTTTGVAIQYGKLAYLPLQWTQWEFVHFVLNRDVDSWDIVSMPNGELRVKVTKK